MACNVAVLLQLLHCGCVVGVSFNSICPVCGFTEESEARFCGWCGNSMWYDGTDDDDDDDDIDDDDHHMGPKARVHTLRAQGPCVGPYVGPGAKIGDDGDDDDDDDDHHHHHYLARGPCVGPCRAHEYG
eukprot:2566111-Karenia_brevis.AAC.1